MSVAPGERSIPSFVTRAAAAVADDRLRAATALVTGRFRDARDRAFAALPEGDALRDHARGIRLHTLAHLDVYLARFIERASEAGATVTAAETAADACRYVTDLARARGVTLAVKSKSMLTEEVLLNDALEASGVRVVETDLGEFIVQLAGDRPSHIIAPVVHRSQDDVAALFRRTLGAPDEDVADVPAMTALARRVLRKEFLRAGMGISGCNFAVAETGSIVTVTNEGNGRLVTTAPPVHVALAGIERIVPTLEDLGVMLQLLARSATGQKLSVYTNVVTGPRRRNEPDGPDELHIVLVDNGRSAMLGSPVAEILACIRCGACLNACPVYQHVGGHAYESVYPGPVGSVVTPALEGIRRRHELPHASSLCGACREACPIRIDLPGLLLELRLHPEARRQQPSWLKAAIMGYRAVATRPRAYRTAARLARSVSSALARGGWIRRLPGPLSGWTAHRDFPAFAPRSFQETWEESTRKRQVDE